MLLGGGEEEEGGSWARWGGGSKGRACTRAVTQTQPDRHQERVSRHMGTPCAASLPEVESAPGAKAHASRNTHTAAHTHGFPMAGGGPFQPCLDFPKCSEGKGRERSWGGERHRPVMGMAPYI